MSHSAVLVDRRSKTPAAEDTRKNLGTGFGWPFLTRGAPGPSVPSRSRRCAQNPRGGRLSGMTVSSVVPVLIHPRKARGAVIPPPSVR